MLKLYDTMRREKVDFEPIDPKNVRMYVCGPTVYDHAHIGNARPVVVFDVLFRLLRHVYGAEHVTYVRNITDVDDKIIDRARRDFPDLDLNAAIAKVTETTTAQFHADVKALGCLKPTVEPRATEHIGGMVEMIGTLIERGHAYIATGAKGREVLFDVTSDADYGALSNRRLDEQQAGARVAVEGHKKNAADFVLWKESADDEPGWDAVFGDVTITGRPGWHIECSAMAKAHLGETFDIHGGGLDLIFPHHENEIAQSCCANGTERMANVWMHNGYLQVEGRKMSKSDGNFVTIDDLLNTEKVGGRKWPGEVVRLALLMTHYREPMDFSVKRLEEARALYRKWGRISDQLPNVPEHYDEALFAPLEDDLNVSEFISNLSTVTSDAMRIQISSGTPASYEVFQEKFDTSAPRLLGVLKCLGFTFTDAGADRYNMVTEQMVEQRTQLLAQKDWAAADLIRDELLSQGIQLRDGKDPETGERVTTWEVVR